MIEGGSAELPQMTFIPLFSNLPSGVMRLTFDQDSSLLVGQTGRGWAALGGQSQGFVRLKKVANKSYLRVVKMSMQDDKLTITFNQRVRSEIEPKQIAQLILLDSFYYTCSSKYGSKPHDIKTETFETLEYGKDRSSITLQLAKNYQWSNFGQRVFHFKLKVQPELYENEIEEKKVEAFLSVTGKPF